MADRIVAQNKKATFNYEIIEKKEAGLVLKGTEIKSIRNGSVSINDSYCLFDKKGELYIHQMYIKPYDQSGKVFNHDPYRPRKLLLHKKELLNWYGKVKERGLTIIPLKVYLKNNKWAKVEIALVRGKKKYDKRKDIAKKDMQREIQRELKNRYY